MQSRAIASPLIDSHCHLDAVEFDTDRDRVLQRAIDAGITRQIVPAVSAATFDKLRGMCRMHEGLFPAYGLHPLFMTEHRPEHITALKQWIDCESPIAVGECGLDFHLERTNADSQLHIFREQLQLARDANLPVIVHARKALDQVIVEIRKVHNLRGVVHSFSGSLEQARRLWDIGFCLGIGGPISYDRARRLRGIVANMPLEYLLLETDAPDQPLQGHQGTRNEPAMLIDVCQTVAALRGVEPSEIAAATTRNCEQLFNLPR
ncbi:MAG TPA: TatD family hydrolase [Rudaea sp.]|nr:TatD family hydrolase [Rudaea sp.]